jgi:hypothetical protein
LEFFLKIYNYSPPIAINFIWSPSDEGHVLPILSAIRKSFSRDKFSPFSRGLNIPIFLYSSGSAKLAPADHPSVLADCNLIFIFTSVNTIGNTTWGSYVNRLPVDGMHLVPIALDSYGLGHYGPLHGINCIRAYDWPEENKDLHAVVALAHEIYRFGFSGCVDNQFGKDSSIKIFLSHAKLGGIGKIFAESIKLFIDNTNMNRFFDANEISPGHRFNEEIEKHIPISTILAITSDAYSSRYWCQREVLSAKKHNRPIVVLNCLEEYEDRIFPAISNVPCVHVAATKELDARDVLRALVASILETIRHNYALRALESYKLRGWIDQDCVLSSRPPELRQVLLIKSQGGKKICYPEPPIYSDEADWHFDLGVDCFTPLWSASDEGVLKNIRVGISISESSDTNYSSSHLHPDSLVRLSQDLARHLLSRSSVLVYGGDLRPDGFSEFILDEALILKDRLHNTKPQIENHLAWPVHIRDEEILAWRAKYHQIMHTEEYSLPPDVASEVLEDNFLSSEAAESRYVRSRSLTHMREGSILASDVRVCAGGKLHGYSGKMPGVLEEIVITLEAKKPIYLLGGFGGVVSEICHSILNKSINDSLTELWQISNNKNYSDFHEFAKTKGHHTDYTTIKTILESISISDLAQTSGLEENDYVSLMKSQFVDECVYLVLQGLKNIVKNKNL